MENAIEVKNLSKTYSDFKLNNITFCVPKGSIMGLIGENGAGKSTTIKEILNLIHKESGEIKIFGKDNIEYETEIKEEIGIVFDECCFHQSFRVRDISKVMKCIYKRWDETIFGDYVNRFQIPQEKVISEFSRGMKMQVSLAIALSHQAKLLILDEATSGLDPVIRDEILDVFLEFIQEENHTILVSSHITSDLEKIADYITFIHKGEVLFSKSKDELLEEYAVIKCSEEDFEKLDKSHIKGVRKNQFAVEFLVDNKMDWYQSEKGLHIEPATIEGIMLFIVRGEK